MSYGLLALKAEELNEYFDNVEKRDTVIKNETNKEQQQSLFSCVFCNKIYKWKKSLNHHIFTIHGNPELIECLICNLKKVHEEKKTAAKKTEQSVCPKCNNAFSKPIYLKRHISIVHEEKSYLFVLDAMQILDQK